jgi:hypothetical protein
MTKEAQDQNGGLRTTGDDQNHKRGLGLSLSNTEMTKTSGNTRGYPASIY